MGVLIKNGIIATHCETYLGDILIEDGFIKKIGLDIEASKNHIIDAKGMYVLPGGVDVHTHLNLDIGIAKAKDDYYTGTLAAACGGTTTIIDHLGFGPKGCKLIDQINLYHNYANNNAVIDYGFHGVIQHIDAAILNEMEEIVINEGITSFKIYLTYDYKLTDKEILKVFQKAKELGIVISVHCENNDIIEYLKEKNASENNLKPKYHGISRPSESEGEAINRIINLAKTVGYKNLYIVHLSSKLGLEYIKMAKKRGDKVKVETCTQYLTLNDSKYKNHNEALKYILSPPLRKNKDIEALWNGIKEGEINVIATDHCPFDFTVEKQLGKNDFRKCPNGLPGIEERMSVIFSEGVMKNRISINKFVEVCCTNPAKIFGMYPLKGTIDIGSHGDIVIIDPNKEFILKNSMLHHNVDYTAYEGLKIKGYPVMTLCRGKVVSKNGEFIGEIGYGKYIGRK